MNVQAHMSGQIAGQLPNQAGTQLPGVPQQNESPFSNQIQNLGGHHNTMYVDPQLAKARKFMQEKIYEWLIQRQQQPHDRQPKQLQDFARRLDEFLFRNAASRGSLVLGDYMNLETLETRLHALIKRLPMSNRNQHHPQLVNAPPIATMIPTPRMTHSGNSITSAVDASMVASSGGNGIAPPGTSVTEGLLPTTTNGLSVGMASGSFNSSDGSMSNGYQQSLSEFSISSSGSMVSSSGVRGMTSQMIPTPGFNSNNTQSFMNLESSNDTGAFSTVGSSTISQPLSQKQHVGGQNSRILHNLGSHIGGGIRSGLQPKAYGFPNGGLGIMQRNSQLINGPGNSEGFLVASSNDNSPKSLPQHYDQHQRPMMHGDGYGISTLDSSGSGNVYGSAMNNQNLNPASLQSLSRANSPLMTNQPNLLTTQQSQSIDQSGKMNFHPSKSSTDNILQSHHEQQFQQQPLRLKQQQLVQHQRQQKQQIQQHQILLKNDSFGHSQLTSDLGSQLKLERGMEHHDEALLSQVSEKFPYSEFQNQFQQSCAEDRSGFAQLLSLPSVSQDICSSPTQTSQQMQQLLHPHQLVVDSQSDFSCISVGVQSERVLPGQWHSMEDKSQIPGNVSQGHHIQEEFRQRIFGQDEAHRNNFASEGSICEVITKPLEPPTSSGATCRSANSNRERQFKNQQRWLLFLRHARRCVAPPGKCQEVNCITAQKLWMHIIDCKVSQCPYPRCHHTKILLHHHKHCRDPGCPVCVPVTNYLQTHLKARAFDNGVIAARLTSKTSPPVVQTFEDLHPSLKRLKTELPSQSLVPETESSAASVLTGSGRHVLHDAQREEHQYADTCMQMKSEVTEVKMEIPRSSGSGSPSIFDMKKDNMDCTYSQKLGEQIILDDSAGSVQKECIKSEKDMDQAKPENVVLPVENAVGTKSGKPKIKGVSMTELFTPEQVREHIRGLRQWVGQSKTKAEKNQAMEHSMSENSCQLCAVEKLTFEPPPIYCSPCGARIKRNAMYYTIGAGDTRHCFCIPCYNEARGDTILVDGTTLPKARMEKKKNDEETEEWWVQCDKCEAWQHQICALFNGRRNDGGQAEYTCPNCYLAEVERGERKPLPQSAVLGAKDLPRTILSDHIENRLFRRLKQEKQERARVQGKSYDEVPGAEALVVRVVSSVDKKLEVKQRFLEIFQEENYPIEYPYKSKKIEGVEVCLFGMYVQEFGSECQQPNHRRVYLSYLDSVKYFRPEIKAVTGEALRTFVYHEILIGYLEYCKKRGFTSCYIWACPPLKGEDYILYCHPEIQKTPKSDKLREWYLSMLRKAAKENIVVDLTNLYDHFFVSTGECKAKVTAARLPYFDGDYWPGAAEDMIYQLRQEDDCRKQYKKGTTKKTITKRALKLSGQSDLSGNASKDWLLMHKVEINDVSEDTKDKDEILESEFFDTRQAFLSLCQGNHYQYDTLRRAKHSSMMVLYHLHNPTAPAFVTTCIKALALSLNLGRCLYLFSNCSKVDEKIMYDHLVLLRFYNLFGFDYLMSQLRKMLDLLVHASQCRSPNCQYPNCRKVKGLFRHGMQCKIRASGGCLVCKKMWYLLQLHARACKESQCSVPRCRDLKEHVRRLQQQSDSRRRAAVMEMMRQRAAEVAGNAE
ncbi:hypothetical protein RHSIM_Rhsim03G0000100 [Rhododendron simsii]|uniref:histone acetyltransferase n=1 Tax=Rhododendron simsii TaxID=118357 RepID=A0A834H6Q4_RHOSS|nr:hypothetical protein RHSIM_Rhsim03G0000100 [Rhododendron simsii]